MIRLLRDIELAHRRRWPGRQMTPVSRSWLLASSPGLRLMLIHRIDHWLESKRGSGNGRAWLWLAMALPFALPKWVIQVNAKSEIRKDCEIEGGVCFVDQGQIILGARSTGAGTTIGARVTIGMSLADAGRPEIGRNVWIGPDCVIYGGISIGDGATLLPGTVLTRSIPAGVVMQGNPARVVLRNFDNSTLRARQDVDAMQHVKEKKEVECSTIFAPT